MSKVVSQSYCSPRCYRSVPKSKKRAFLVYQESIRWPLVSTELCHLRNKCFTLLPFQCSEGSRGRCALLSYLGRNSQRLCWIHSKSGVTPSGLWGAESALYFECQLLVRNSKTTQKENPYRPISVAVHRFTPRFLHLPLVQSNLRLNLFLCGSKHGQLKSLVM